MEIFHHLSPSIDFPATVGLSGSSGRTPHQLTRVLLAGDALAAWVPLDPSSVVYRHDGGGFDRNHLTRHRVRARPCTAHQGVWTAFPSPRCRQPYRSVSLGMNASAMLPEGQTSIGGREERPK